MKARHAAAFLLGILCAVPCQATWLVIGETDKTMLILDNDTISYASAEDKTNRVAVLVNVMKTPVDEFAGVASSSGKAVKQVIRSMQFDCKAKKSRIVTGELLDDNLDTLGFIDGTNLASPLKDTLTEKELTVVCAATVDNSVSSTKIKKVTPLTT
jgi:hypothetical protein